MNVHKWIWINYQSQRDNKYILCMQQFAWVDVHERPIKHSTDEFMSLRKF